MDPYRNPSRHAFPGVDLIDPEAVRARAWVPPTKATAPAEASRPVLPGQPVVFRAGPPSNALTLPAPPAATPSLSRVERRGARTRRRVYLSVAVASAALLAALAAAAAFVLA